MTKDAPYPTLSYAAQPASRTGHFSMLLALIALGLYLLLLGFVWIHGKRTGLPVLLVVANLCTILATALTSIVLGIFALFKSRSVRRTYAIAGILVALLTLACLAMTT